MKTILSKLGLWLLKREWFQFAVVKYITNLIENSETKLDDNLLAFIKEHKRSLGTIAKKEINKASTVIDERLATAIKSI